MSWILYSVCCSITLCSVIRWSHVAKNPQAVTQYGWTIRLSTSPQHFFTSFLLMSIKETTIPNFKFVRLVVSVISEWVVFICTYRQIYTRRTTIPQSWKLNHLLVWTFNSMLDRNLGNILRVGRILGMTPDSVSIVT